jgi:putative DNA-invertase from lambdoid prophage Rac
MKVAIYTRVSTEEQNTERQASELREFAKARGWNVVMEESDRRSGKDDQRPGYRRVMDAAKKRRIDVVLVHKLDRWGRSVKQLITSLEELKAVGVKFVSLGDGFDFTTPQGELMYGIVAAFAQFERALIRERVVSGMRLARKNGKHCGRPRCHVDAARVRKMRKDGATWEEVAAAIGAPRSVCQRAVL